MDIESTLASLRSSVEKTATAFSSEARGKLAKTLRDLAQSLETPTETAYRASNPAYSIIVCIDLGIYNILAASDEAVSLDTIAQQTKADIGLLNRLLRHQASCGNVTQPAKHMYAANNSTRNLALKEVQACIKYVSEVVDIGARALPAFLRETNYRNPQDVSATAFNRGSGFKGTCWDWQKAHPEYISLLNEFMPLAHDPEFFFEHYPIEKASKDWSADKPFFVDMGGASGSQTIALRKGLPNFKGRLIVQDLPEVVALTQYPADIAAQGHDFFTPQPVKGAKFYYLRTILHDWPDDECVEILKNIVPALEPGSHILIDESLVPETNASWMTTHTDLAMMVICAGSERSQEQWETVAARAGLKIDSITTFTPLFRASIIDLVKA